MIVMKFAIAAFLFYLLWSVIGLAWRFWKIFRTVKAAFKPQQQRAQSLQNTMVKCATCQMYILDRDAVSLRGTYFCSPEHMQASR